MEDVLIGIAMFIIYVVGALGFAHVMDRMKATTDRIDPWKEDKH